MSRASKLLKTYLEKASNGEDLSDAKLVITAMLPYFVIEEDFCKLPYEFVSSIFKDYDEKFEKQDAMEFIENAAKYYQKDAVTFLSGIDCGHIGPEAAAAILQPLNCVPLIRELLKATGMNVQSPTDENQEENQKDQNQNVDNSSQYNESSNISSPKRSSRKPSQAENPSESPKNSSYIQNSSKINESSSISSPMKTSRNHSQPQTQVDLSQYSDVQSFDQQSQQSSFFKSNKQEQDNQSVPEVQSSPSKRDKSSHSSHRSKIKDSKSQEGLNDIFSAISKKDTRAVEMFISNNPNSIAFCVGKLKLLVFFIK